MGHVFWQILRQSAINSLKLGRSPNVPDNILLQLSDGLFIGPDRNTNMRFVRVR